MPSASPSQVISLSMTLNVKIYIPTCSPVISLKSSEYNDLREMALFSTSMQAQQGRYGWYVIPPIFGAYELILYQCNGMIRSSRAVAQ